MEIVDAQVHANHRGIEQSIAVMDAVGVNAAVIDVWPPVRNKLPSGIFRFEYPFAEEAVSRFPGRFAYVARFDPNDPEIDEQVGQVRKAPNRLCIRLASGFDMKVLHEGGHERILAAAGKHGRRQWHAGPFGAHSREFSLAATSHACLPLNIALQNSRAVQKSHGYKS